MTSKGCTFYLIHFSCYPGMLPDRKRNYPHETTVHFNFIQIMCVVVCAPVYFNSMTDLKIFLQNFQNKI